MSGTDDAEESRRRYKAPYTGHHPIPTIQKYREEKTRREQESGGGGDEVDDGQSKTERAKDAYNNWRSEDDDNIEKDGKHEQEYELQQEGGADRGKDGNEHDEDDAEGEQKDTTEHNSSLSPKQKRKGMKKRKEERAEREVTDPVTHLPVTIHDFTSAGLKELDENDPPSGTTARTATGVSNMSKSDSQLREEHEDMEEGGKAMQSLFPPPGKRVTS